MRSCGRFLYWFTCVVTAIGLMPARIAVSQDSRNLAVSGTSAQTQNESRVALVIGNAQYKASPLRNPVNDARSVASALRDLGFQTTVLENQSKREMSAAIRAFGRSLTGTTVGLFYFAGHGVQVGGRNYLIPVDADIDHEDDVEEHAVDASSVLSRMDFAKNRLNLVILDACRNNPFARSFRSGIRGLAQMDAPSGTLVAFSTAPGSVASDGDDENGIYTKHLLRYIKEPGLPVEQLFKQVRIGVAQETRDRQIPWESSSLKGDFYFRPVDKAQVEAERRRLTKEEIDKAVRDALRRETERLAAEQRSQKDASKEKAEREAKLEQERIARERADLLAEREKLRTQREELERLLAARDQLRVALEREAADRAAQEEAARRDREEKLRQIAEAERRAAEEQGRRLAMERAEADRAARAAAEALEAEARRNREARDLLAAQEEALRVSRERAEAERIAALSAKQESERLARLKAEQDERRRNEELARRLAEEREALRLAEERAAAEKLAAESARRERERVEAIRLAAVAKLQEEERIAREKADVAERIRREEFERALAARQEALRLAAERAAMAEKEARESAQRLAANEQAAQRPVQLALASPDSAAVVLSRPAQVQRPRVVNGQEWTYNVIDAWNQKLDQVLSLRVSDVTDGEIKVDAIDLLSDSKIGREAYTRDWNVRTGVLSSGSTLRTFDPYDSLLEFPLEVGKSWDHKSVLVGTAGVFDQFRLQQSGKVLGWERVTVPAGVFDAIKILVEGYYTANFAQSDYRQRRGQRRFTIWYAPAVGRWVKLIYEDTRLFSPYSKVIHELTNFKAN